MRQMTTHWWAYTHTLGTHRDRPSHEEGSSCFLSYSVESCTLPWGSLSLSGSPTRRGLQHAPQVSIWCQTTCPEAGRPRSGGSSDQHSRAKLGTFCSSSTTLHRGEGGQWSSAQPASPISSTFTPVTNLTDITAVASLASLTSITYLTCLTWLWLSTSSTRVATDRWETRGTTGSRSKGEEEGRERGGADDSKLNCDAYGCVSEDCLKLCQVMYQM